MKFLVILSFMFLFGFFDLCVFFFLCMFGVMNLMLEMSHFWFGGIFFCDSISYFLSFLTLMICLFCIFSSNIENWNSNEHMLFFFVLFMIFFLLFFSFMSMNMMMFYLTFELIFIFMFIFVLAWGVSPERVQASFYMVFYTIVVSFPFLFYMVCFESSVKILKFHFFFSFTSYWWFFVFFVFLIKLPVYGFHLWLPKAHVEAPVSGSMVLAGVLLKLGAYGFFRFSSLVNLYLSMSLGYLVSLGLLGGLMSCFLCLRQVDLKSFVDYSSICHMGFALSGIYSSSEFGFLGGLYMMIAHGFCSSCLFFVLYVFYERFGTRSMMMLKGLNYLYPFMMLVWFIYSILNMGVPPSFSFFSEINILVGLISSHLLNFMFVAVFLMFAGLYGIFLFVVMSHGKSSLGSGSYFLSSRELLNIYGHFYFLIFIIFFITFFLCV